MVSLLIDAQLVRWPQMVGVANAVRKDDTKFRGQLRWVRHTTVTFSMCDFSSSVTNQVTCVGRAFRCTFLIGNLAYHA